MILHDIDVCNMEKYRWRHENAVLSALKVELAFALVQQLMEGKLFFIPDMLMYLSSSYGKMAVNKSLFYRSGSLHQFLTGTLPGEDVKV